jgi:uncharacterized protein YggU (UPF0235/DUF167 family)
MSAAHASGERRGLEPRAGGASCALTIRAQPGARRSGFAGFWNGLVKVAVSAPPEGGRANDALRDEVATIAGVRAAAVRLVAGAKSREKRFEIDAPEADVRARIDALAGARAGTDAGTDPGATLGSSRADANTRARRYRGAQREPRGS